jgi:hypothetical protein
MAVTVLKEAKNKRGKFRVVMEDRGDNILVVQEKKWYGWGDVYKVYNRDADSIKVALLYFDLARRGLK